MPREVGVVVPLDVRVAGIPSRATLAQLERELAATVLIRLAEAQRELADRGWRDVERSVEAPRLTLAGVVADDDRRLIEATLLRAVNAAIAESGIARRSSLARRGGAPAPPRTAPRGPAWTIVGRARVVTTIAELTGFIAAYGSAGNETVPILEALYADRGSDPVEVVVARIAVRRPQSLDAIGAELAARAQAATPAGKVAVWIYTTETSAPPRLAEIASEREGELEPLRTLFGSVRRLADRSVVTLAGAEILFAHAYLPLVEALDLIELSTKEDLSVEVETAELDFMVHRESFERLLGVRWTDYRREFGALPTKLYLRPFRTRRLAHYRSISYFMDQETSRGVAADTLFFGRTRVLTDDLLAALPKAARGVAAGYADATSRALASLDSFGIWLEGWRGLHFYALFHLTSEQQLVARNRQRAERAAARLAPLLRNADPHSIEWVVAMLNLFAEHFVTAGDADQQATFDMTLDLLAEQGLFAALFSAIETADFYTLHSRLVRFSGNGRHARHPRVQETTKRLNDRAARRRMNRYDAASGRLLLDGRGDRPVAIGGVVGDVDGTYINEVEVVELPAPLREQLRRQALREAEKLAQAVLSGAESRSFTPDEFTRECLTRAVEALAITDDSFIERTIEISARLLAVQRSDVDGIEQFSVTWTLCRRYRGEHRWEDIEGSRRTALAGYFEEVLTFWRIRRGFEFVRIMATVMAIGTIVILGVVFLPELIALGGGLKVILASVAIAELIYIARVIFTDEKFTFAGFALAALDGYLFAVGFRLGAFVAEGVALRIISSSTTRALGTARIASLVTRGAVSGGSSGFLVTFAHDLYDIGTGRRAGFSSLGTYALHIGLGTVLGVAGELAVSAAMTRVMAAFAAAGRPGAHTMREIAQIAQRLREEGVSLARFAAESQNIRNILRERLASVLDDVIANGVLDRFTEVLRQIRRAYPAQVQTQRFLQGLELVQLRLGPSGLTGLERFIQAAGSELDEVAAMAVVRSLHRAGQARASQFFDILGTLDAATLRALTRGGQLGALLDSSAAGELAQTAPQLLAALLRIRFGYRIGDLDRLLRELAELTTDGLLQTRILTTLVDRPTLPIRAVTATVARLGALPDEAVLGLSALFRTGRNDAELAALLARTDRHSLARLLGLARALGPADMAAVIERDVVLQFARSPAAASFLERQGWVATSQVLEQRFGSAFAPFDSFARRLEALGVEAAGVRSVVEALRQNGRYSNDSLLGVARALGEVAPADRLALDALFALEDDGIARAAVDALVLRQVQHGAATTRTLLALPERLGDDLAAFARLDALEALARHPQVFPGVARAIDRQRVLELLRPPAGGAAPDPAGLIAGLADLVTAQPGTRLRDILPPIGQARRLPRLPTETRPARQLAADETLTVLQEIVRGARLGSDVFASGATAGTSTRDILEATARLIGDEVHPRVARQAFDVTQAGVSDLPVAGAVRTEFRVAGAGDLRPDLALAFVDRAGDTIGLAGREMVTIHPQAAGAATTRAELVNTLANAVSRKARAVPTNQVTLEARVTGARIVAQEIDVQLLAHDADAFFTRDVVVDMLAQMRRTGSNDLVTFVDRVRFYGPDGELRFVWSNPTPPHTRP